MSKKNLKKALIPSLIALALCFAMLLGTTFAWFTDTASTGTNVIASGKLDIELEYKNDQGTYVTADGVTLLPATIKWEPGYMAVINARVINNGDLAIKYTLKINVTEATTDPDAEAPAANLAEVIKVYYAPSEVAVTRELTGLTELGTLAQVLAGGENYDVKDTLEKNGDIDYATIVLVMDPAAGNAYQGLSLGDGFSIQVVATQATYEKDSIDDQYDAAAEFPTD